jgi:hypothetical protein
MSTVSKAQQQAVAKYVKAHYDELKIRVPKGFKATVKAHADAREMSVNAYIVEAIQKQMQEK